MRPSRLAFVSVALATAMLTSAPAAAQRVDLPAHGGNGGQPFRAECADGSFLVGLEGRVGAFLDQIAPVCAPWSPLSGSFGMPVPGRAAGGQGGRPQASRCSAGTAVQLILFTITIDGRTRDPAHVSDVFFDCGDVLTGAFVRSGNLASSDHSLGPSGGGTCAPGEFAVGIHGRADLHVDRLGLICGPAPKKAGAPIRAVGPPPGSQPNAPPVTAPPVKAPPVNAPPVRAPIGPPVTRPADRLRLP